MALLARTRATAGLARASRTSSKATRAVRAVFVRAEKNDEGMINFGGQQYTAAEWEAAKATGNLPTAEPVAVPAGAAATPAPVSFGQLMAFSGPAPEVVNGRLAMLGVVAALAAEFASGESVLKQLADEPTGIFIVFGLIIAASFAPLLKNSLPTSESFGPFTAKAEMLNGRAAMIGFAALVAIELARGSALF